MKVGNMEIPTEQIEAFCRKWRITQFALFGSVLRENFRPDSDVDVLVTFADDVHWGLFDIVRMEDELKAIFDREVDLVTRRSVEESPNYIRRNHILAQIEVVHVAG